MHQYLFHEYYRNPKHRVLQELSHIAQNPRTGDGKLHVRIIDKEHGRIKVDAPWLSVESQPASLWFDQFQQYFPRSALQHAVSMDKIVRWYNVAGIDEDELLIDLVTGIGLVYNHESGKMHELGYFGV